MQHNKSIKKNALLRLDKYCSVILLRKLKDAIKSEQYLPLIGALAIWSIYEY